MHIYRYHMDIFLEVLAKRSNSENCQILSNIPRFQNRYEDAKLTERLQAKLNLWGSGFSNRRLSGRWRYDIGLWQEWRLWMTLTGFSFKSNFTKPKAWWHSWYLMIFHDICHDICPFSELPLQSPHHSKLELPVCVAPDRHAALGAPWSAVLGLPKTAQ